jgi:hypothetical protein
MVAVRPNPSVAAERAVDRLRDANREPLHAAAKLRGAVCFGEQMDVVVLHTEVKQTESVLGYSRECRTYGTEDVVAPKRRQTSTGAERHVDGAARIMQRSSSVRHAPAPGSGLTSSALSPTAPGWWRSQLQLPSSTPHLEPGIYYSKVASMSSLNGPDVNPTRALGGGGGVGRRGCLDTLALARPVGAAAGPRWRRGWTFAKRVIASGEGDTLVIVVDVETARPASPCSLRPRSPERLGDDRGVDYPAAAAQRTAPATRNSRTGTAAPPTRSG